jgi:protein-S-isoprenylcysteine O-methyltransferase Ste14
MSLGIRNVLFTFVVPGLGAGWIPWRILDRFGGTLVTMPWAAGPIAVMAAGAAIYLLCLRLFAVVGRGTPGPWDAPRRLVAVGPYRWVRNPIYLSALLVVLGEAWLFLSWALLLYVGIMGVSFHLFVIGYEERTLRRRFGESYARYSRAVSRWVPRPPERV